MKTSELQGAALDWAVAKCELMAGQNYTLSIDDDGILKRVNYGGMYPEWSCEWEEAGPIIEREGIQLRCGLGGWVALPYDSAFSEEAYQEGDTPLVAAMRCYVASKLGDEVEVPDELEGGAK
jgi:hypothetical protein